MKLALSYFRFDTFEKIVKALRVILVRGSQMSLQSNGTLFKRTADAQ